MKKRLTYYTLHVLGFLLILILLSSLVQSNNIISLVVYAVIWAFVTKIAVFIYKFFLLPSNILVYVLTQTIINTGYLYLLEMLAPAIHFVGGAVKGFETDVVTIKTVEVTGIYSLIITAFVLALASYYFKFLVENK